MLDDDALAQVAFMAERRSHSIWWRARDAMTFGTAGSAGAARPKPSDLASPVALALLFWAVTYTLFTVRAFTISNDASILSTLRFSTTGTGAILVGLFLAQVTETTIARNATILRILVVAVGASTIVWTARNLYAAIAPEPFTSIADNARWAMFWGGYCTAFLSLYLLHLAKRGQILQRGASAPAEGSPVTAREAALSWLVDALADELRGNRGLDDVFFDRVSRDIRIGPVEPQGVARGAMAKAADEIIDRLRRHSSAPSFRHARRFSTTVRRAIA